MNKKMWLAAVALSFGLGVANAAEIANLSGQSCGALSGTWHFVNNKTGGSPAGTLTATWSSGDSCTVGASAVNNRAQQFYCSASGTLLSAVTNLPGRLVLSDFNCDTKEPPKCDPNVEKCL